MADYSNLRKLYPDMLGRAYARGLPFCDEDIFNAFCAVEPAFLPPLETATIKRILGHASGRPRKDEPNRKELIEQVLGVDRPDIPLHFLEALAARLRLKKGLTSRELYGPESRRRARKWDREIIYCLYYEFYELQDGEPFIEHEVLGKVEVPQGPSSRSERALVMTRNTFRDRMGKDPPVIATLRNIITREKKYRAKIVSDCREFSR